jgi:hypothetical protein
LDPAGRDLAEYMMKDLSRRGYYFTTAAVRVIARDVKQGLCYIALDFDTELEAASENSDEEKTHELPDIRLRMHESPWSLEANRERRKQVRFETCNVPAM